MELIKTRVNRRLVLSEYSGGIRFGTDALLLVHFALSAPGRGMDLGAGSGIIGFLLLTSGRASHIDGIELQPDYVDLCRKNASENGLEARYTAVCRDIRDLHSFPEEEYDFCVSNPPYLPLGCGKENASEPLNIARREVKCDILSVCAAASRSVRSGGSVFVVFRPDRLAALLSALRASALEPKRIRTVCPSSGRKPSLVLVEAIKNAPRGNVSEEQFCIYGDSSHRDYSEGMKNIYNELS